MSSDFHDSQKITDGYGPVYHRTYSISFVANEDETTKAMADLQKDLNRFSPQLLAHFKKVIGSQSMKCGDEFDIRISGPWNGPVRVAEVRDDYFRLVTLDGHMEAGEIQFRICRLSSREMIFEVESFARSRDAIVDFVYDKVPVAKMVQTEMWSIFCENFAKHVIEVCRSKDADDFQIGEVKVITERRDEETNQWKRI